MTAVKTQMESWEFPLSRGREAALEAARRRIIFARYITRVRCFGWRSIAVEAIGEATLLRQAVRSGLYGDAYWRQFKSVS